MFRGGLLIREKREKLAVSQEQLGELVGTNVGIIHRIETGKKVPDDTLVWAIANALRINAEALIRAFDEDRKAKHTKREDLLSLPTLLDWIDEEQELITLCLDVGETSKALRSVNRWTEEITQRCARERNKRIIRELQSRTIDMLLARIECNLFLSPRYHAENSILADVNEVYRLTDILGDLRRQDYASARLSDAYWMDRKAENAYSMATKLIVINGYPEHLFLTHRARLVSYAYVGRKQNYLDVEEAAWKDLEKGKILRPGDRASILEAMGRGRCDLGLGDADRILNLAQIEASDSEQGGRRTLRIIQTLRSKLYVVAKQTTSDKGYGQELVRTIQNIMPLSGLASYATEINQLAAQIGIPDRLEVKKSS